MATTPSTARPSVGGAAVEKADTGSLGGRGVALPVIPRGLGILLGLAAAVIILAGIRATAWLIGPILLALVIVIGVHPIQRWMRRHGWPGWVSTLVLVVVVYGLLVAFSLVIAVSLARLSAQLPTFAGSAQDVLARIPTTLQRLGVEPQQAQTLVGSANFGNVLRVVNSVLFELGSALSGLILLIALLLFLSVEASGAGARLASIAADRGEVVAAIGSFAVNTRKYLAVTTVFGLLVAVVDGVALALLGIPQPVLWGVLAFITNYIPNIGFFLGLLPQAILALLIGGWPMLVWVVVIYCLANFVLQSLVQPRITGDVVGLSAAVTFVSLVFWTWILGALGALLAVPLTLLAKALLVDSDPRATWADAWLRADPGGSPSARRPTRAAGPAGTGGQRHGAADAPDSRTGREPRVTGTP